MVIHELKLIFKSIENLCKGDEISCWLQQMTTHKPNLDQQPAAAVVYYYASLIEMGSSAAFNFNFQSNDFNSW